MKHLTWLNSVWDCSCYFVWMNFTNQCLKKMISKLTFSFSLPWVNLESDDACCRPAFSGAFFSLNGSKRLWFQLDFWLNFANMFLHWQSYAPEWVRMGKLLSDWSKRRHLWTLSNDAIFYNNWSSGSNPSHYWANPRIFLISHKTRQPGSGFSILKHVVFCWS